MSGSIAHPKPSITRLHDDGLQIFHMLSIKQQQQQKDSTLYSVFDFSHVILVGFVVKNSAFALQAYDQHLNMILGDVEEIVTTVEIDDETYEEIVRVCSLSHIVSFLFFFFVFLKCNLIFIVTL